MFFLAIFVHHSVLFVMLGKILSPYKTPPFTLPFNIATIFFLLAMGGMHNVDMAPVRQPQLPSYDVEPVSALTAKAFFAGSIRGEFCENHNLCHWLLVPYVQDL